MARQIGRVVERRGGWAIDFGRRAVPRYLYSAFGNRFERPELAGSVLEAIRVAVARGSTLQKALDQFAPSSGRNSIQRWLDEYIERQAARCVAGELSPGTIAELRRCARAELIWWSGRSLADVTPMSLDEWVRWLAGERALAPKTLANALGTFRAFLRWLARMEQIDRVPPFPQVRVPEHTPTIISPRTQQLILDQIAYSRRGVFLAMAHGIRPGESRALDMSDVQERDWSGGTVVGLMVSRAVKGLNASSPIRGTKTGEGAWVPVSDQLAEWIAWRRGQRGAPWSSPALAPHTGRARPENPDLRWSHGELTREWRRACRAAGVRVSLYEGLKHSSATAWRAEGVPLEIVQRLLRHRRSVSTERYAKLADGALVEALRGTSRPAAGARRRSPKRER